MNPISSQYIAQLHAEELHRQAAAHRFVEESRPTVDTLPRLRIAAGKRLISLGERLLPGAPIRNIGYQR